MKKICFFIVFIFAFISCDNDYNSIGGELIGDENFIYDTEVISVNAYNSLTGEIQTNNTGSYQLGIYFDPFFGKTSSSLVFQVGLPTNEPKFGKDIEIETAHLYIPYFSSVKEKKENETIYELKNVYGTPEQKFSLSVYENGYFINSFDAENNFQTPAKYFSDSKTKLFENIKLGNNGMGQSVVNGVKLNDNPDVKQNTQFTFLPEEIVIYKTKLFNGILKFVDDEGKELTDQMSVSARKVKERLAPGIYLELNKNYIKNRILKADPSNLVNNNAFRQYFRGLYLKVEDFINGEGKLAKLDLNKAAIKINYESIADNETERKQRSLDLSIGNSTGNNVVNLNENVFSTNYANGLASSSAVTNGKPENLYLKGGVGSVAYLNIFPNTNQLDDLRSKKLFINDAKLFVYLDDTKISTTDTKQIIASRIFLFDAKNNRPLTDFNTDDSKAPDVKQNKFIFGGIYDPNDKVYIFRIGNHINNILNNKNQNFNENVILGLYVTEDINTNGIVEYKDPIDVNGNKLKFLTTSSVISPFGTVLHGPGSTNSSKKMRLEIYFSKPK